jgi:hypothetical protein
VAAVAVVAAAMLAVAVLPRALPDTDRGPSGGVRLTVMTIKPVHGQSPTDDGLIREGQKSMPKEGTA